MKALLDELLKKIPNIEQIISFSFDVFVHPQKDNGVLNNGVEFVRPYINDYKYLLICFDFEGCGKENQGIEVLESRLVEQLNSNGWKDRNQSIIFNPELEIWLWVDDSKIHELLDWEDKKSIYNWIEDKGFKFKEGVKKPIRPKEAFEAALRYQKIPKSSSLYAQLAQTASYKKCHDPAFNKFIGLIQKWFSNSSLKSE
ncbi:MAG TPA: hypothetical protein DHW82_09045 [Spirochaetia bacterium]|nr:hypothetical protein [Spirochaetia bacterium]